jgi:hypothetical protein
VKLYLMVKVMRMFLRLKVLLVKTCYAVSQLALVLMILLVDMAVVPLIVLTCDTVQLLEMVVVVGKFVDVAEVAVLPLEQCPHQWIILTGR